MNRPRLLLLSWAEQARWFPRSFEKACSPLTSWRYCQSLFIIRSTSFPDWNSGSHDPLLRASEALILSRLITDGSNSIVIRFENTLISASMTPRVLRSFSSKSNGRSPSFVPDRSRMPRARRPVGAASLTAPFLTVPDCTIVFRNRLLQTSRESLEYLRGRFTLALESTHCIHSPCISMKHNGCFSAQSGRPG